MSFDIGVIPFLVLLFLGALPQFYFMKLLSKEVSRKRLDQVEDLGALWKTTFPPSIVLTDKGLKLQKWQRIYLVVTVLIALVLGFFFTGFSASPIKGA